MLWNAYTRKRTALPEPANWETAYLWRLAMPQTSELKEVRAIVSALKRHLGMCTPSLEEYRPHLPPEEFDRFAELSHSRAKARYLDSLDPLITAKSADAISLLASLVAECLVADDEVLAGLHWEAFLQATRHLLASTYIADVEQQFQELSTMEIMMMHRDPPLAPHASLLNAPFISINQWREITAGRYLAILESARSLRWIMPSNSR